MAELEWRDADEFEALARERLARHVRIGQPVSFNTALMRDLAGLGLFRPFYPKEFGGSGDGRVSATLLCNIREGLARVSPEFSTSFATQLGGFFVPALHGGTEVKRRWVPPIVAGEAVCAVALTEPALGSDVASIAMPATKVEGGWRLSGRKTWIMKAPAAAVYTVFARTSLSGGSRGISAFVVPADSEGLSAAPMDTLWPDVVGNVSFDNVFVPDQNLVGPLDGAFKLGMGIFDAFRPSVGAHVVGLARAALDASIAYARERTAFGKRIAEFQAVSHLVADMATQLKAARLLVYDAATIYDRGDMKAAGPAAAMAKLFASRAAQFVVDGALQVHGAAGLERGQLVEHLYREVRPSRIYEGTDQIQREIIARQILS